MTERGNNLVEGTEKVLLGEKEMKLLMHFVMDALKEVRDCEDIEKKNNKIDSVLDHIQQYLED